MLLGTNFDSIDQKKIQNLVDAGATETIHLEFKRDTYGKSNDDKKELLKDITSFANTLGGHLIIGVDEKEGMAVAVTPLTGIDVDDELLRLESIVQTGIEPKIIGLRMKREQVDAGDVIVIQIPHSYNPPHRVIFRNSNRYYARNSTSVYELSLEELRMHFGQQRSIEERAKSFVNKRFLRFQANDGALPVQVEKGAMIMHLVPLPDFGADRRLAIAELKDQQTCFPPIGSSSCDFLVNLDGIIVYRSGNGCHGYTQIYRDGSVEATSASIITDRGDGPTFGSVTLPKKIIDALNRYMQGLKVLERIPPILLQISFLGMEGVTMAMDPSRGEAMVLPYEREELHLPPTIISDYRDDDNYENVIAEQMDFLWNAYGLEKCTHFDSEGKWV